MSFVTSLRDAAARGLVKAVEWALVILVVLFAANYVLNIRQAALNGAQALAIISAYQQAKVLPTSLSEPAK